MIYVLCLLLLMIGVFGALSQKNLVKIILSVAVAEYAVNLFIVLLGYRAGGAAPIMASRDAASFAAGSVDPLPQAMVLTAIVIGLGVLALMVAIALRLYHTYGTYDATEIRTLRG